MNTTPLTGQRVRWALCAPGCASTSRGSTASLVAHANRHTPDIAGSKFPVIPPAGAEQACLVSGPLPAVASADEHAACERCVALYKVAPPAPTSTSARTPSATL